MGSCFKNLLLGATLVLSFLPQGASSCTTIIAGNFATVDGTIYVARNADNSPLKVPYYIFHEASTKGPTRYSTRAKGGVNDFTITLPAKTLAYSSIPNWKTKIHGAAGFNSAGVGISATETIYIKPEVLKKDPFNTRTGITEDDIVDVILAQATSAKDGVRILGEIIKQKGAGEGFGVAFVDAREAWYLETASGHRWMARRVPNDCYFVAANQGRLRDFRAFDPDFAGSVDLIDWAQNEGFFKGSPEAFDFTAVFHRNDERDYRENAPRVWQAQRLLTPSKAREWRDSRELPLFAKADRKITLADIKRVLRDHYASTIYDPYTEGYRPQESLRPISIFDCYQSHILAVRPNLPEEVGHVTWLALGMSALSLYVPFYQGFHDIPKAYQTGTETQKAGSAYWLFRRIQTLAMADFANLKPIVREVFDAFEDKTIAHMRRFEANYLKLRQNDPRKAATELTRFNREIIKDALSCAQALADKLEGLAAEAVSKRDRALRK